MKRKILLVENLLLSPLPFIILIDLLFYITITHPLMTGWKQQCLSTLLWQNTKHNINSNRKSSCLSVKPFDSPLLFQAGPPPEGRGTGGGRVGKCTSERQLWCEYLEVRIWEPQPSLSQRGPLFSFELQPHPTPYRFTWTRKFHLRQNGCARKWTRAKS